MGLARFCNLNERTFDISELVNNKYPLPVGTTVLAERAF